MPPSKPRHRRPLCIVVLATAGALISLSACAPPTPVPSTEIESVTRPDLAVDETEEGFDLAALVEAAQQEGPITVYDETGKVVKIAEAFTEKYGIQATGVKVMSGIQDKVSKEYESGNVIGDVVVSQEVPRLYTGLMAEGMLTNWVPGDMYDTLPGFATYPFLNIQQGYFWSYNTDTYGDTCPVDNIWELTDPEWAGHAALEDPENRAVYATAWNQASRNQAEEYAAAYEELYGEELKTDEPTAVHEWVKRFAGNDPVALKDPHEAADAAGPGGQKEPPIVLVSASEYRYNEQNGYHLAPCEGLNPSAGFAAPAMISYAAKTKSPNVAKLYIHFATSQEGMDFITVDGKSSFSTLVDPGEDKFGVFALFDDGQIQEFDTEHLQDDYSSISSWMDLWRSNR